MEDEADIIGIISLRKYELYEQILEDFLDGSKASGYDTSEIKKIIEDAVSKIPNRLMISDEEKEAKKIRGDISIKDLKLDDKEISQRIEMFIKYS